MKVQLLYLEHFDDRVSAGEKLKWARADRVLMVWPSSGEVLTGRLDLVLLQRQASAQRVQLGLVSHHPSVRRHARDLGLPVFDDIDNLPEKRWQKAKPPARPPIEQLDPAHLRHERVDRGARDGSERPGRSLRARRTLFGLGLGALALLASAVLPWAEVIVGPEVRTVEVSALFPLAEEARKEYLGSQPQMDERAVRVEGSLRRATAAAGSSRNANRRPTVSSSDLSDLQADLEEALLQAGAQAIERQLAPLERMLEGSLRIASVLNREFDTPPGEVAATVGLEMQVEVRALVVEDGDLHTFASSSLDDQIPDGWVAVPGSLSYNLSETRRRGSPYLDFRAELRTYQPRAIDSIAVAIPGMQVPRAREEVRRLLDVGDVTFELSPEWLPWLPILPNRIAVRYPWEQR